MHAEAQRNESEIVVTIDHQVPVQDPRSEVRASSGGARAPRRSPVTKLVAGLAVGALIVTGCSSSGTDSTDSTTSASTTSAASATSTVKRPAGPAATVTDLTGGKGTLLLSPTKGPDLKAAGYVESEYQVAGTATAYRLADGAKVFPTDGKMDLEEAGTAPYATRIVVRRPSDPAKFSGTVVAEWNNVSGGIDVAPDWTYAADEIIRSGDAWVGVSTQMIGIEGGPVAVSTPVSAMGGAGKGIKNQDPARYGKLHHPGDAYAYDIYTQVARALRANSGATRPLGDLSPERVLAMGESQSAYALTTYYDGVQPLADAFDGFLVHSRGGAALPLGEPGKPTDITAAVTSTDPVKFRTDLDTPVVTVLTETDVAGILAYYPARQPDNDHLRVWEAAGTAHVDTFQLGDEVAKLFECPKPVNSGPGHFFVASGLAHLETWVTSGKAPAHGTPLEVTPDGKDYVRDGLGIAKGGIRTPQVDVPVDVLSGLPTTGPDSSLACFLAGSTTPIPPEKLVTLYPSAKDYLDKYTAATDKAIEAGFVLPADRQAMLDDAQPGRLSG